MMEQLTKFKGKKRYKGFVDKVEKLIVTGWAFNEDNPGERVEVVVLVDGKPVAEGIADQFRQDLLDAGIGDGKHAFAITLPSEFADGREHEVRVVCEKTQEELKNSPVRFLKEPLKKDADISKLRIKSTEEIRKYFKKVLDNSTPVIYPDNVKIIAFYLPQFHPIPENDEWWGPGYTEWTKVSQTKPLFKGHYQPRIPQELGFYDLRAKEVIEKQIELAKEYGVYGFCFHYYWFEGRRLLEKPLNIFLESEIDFPFMICWANENWTRRWDGSENEVLIPQVHNPETDILFIEDVMPLFEDPRYIKINGAPVIIIYRISLMPEPKKTVEVWKRMVKKRGFPDLIVLMSETFGLKDPYNYGCDGSVDFPPHTSIGKEITQEVEDLVPDFSGHIFCYEDVVKHVIGRIFQHPPSYRWYPTVMLGWDNSPRRGKSGTIFHHFSPEMFEVWLRACVDFVVSSFKPEERFVFVNAWNEWGEGTYLEPDMKYGRANLEAVRRSITRQHNWKSFLDYIKTLPEVKGDTKLYLERELELMFNSYEKVIEYLLAIVGNAGLPKEYVKAKKVKPNSIKGKFINFKNTHHFFDQINHLTIPKDKIIVDKNHKLYIIGWFFVNNKKIEKNTPTFLFFEGNDENIYYTFVPERVERIDVANSFSIYPKEVTLFSGFKVIVDISDLEVGCYKLGIITDYDGELFGMYSDIILEVI